MALALIAYPEIKQVDFKWIQSVRKQEDELYFNVINPHFTIIFPVFNIKEPDLCEHIKSCLSGFGSFYFTLDHAEINKDSFNEYWHTFLVPKEGYESIVQLHDLAYTGILKPELREDILFVPHIGIGNSKDYKLTQELTNKLNKQNINIRGKISKLDLIIFKDNQVDTIRSFKLNK